MNFGFLYQEPPYGAQGLSYRGRFFVDNPEKNRADLCPDEVSCRMNVAAPGHEGCKRALHPEPNDKADMKMLGAIQPLILVVDDFADNREMFTEFLAFHGFRVAEASTGREALDRAFQLLPDVILMDLSLPELDGLEATR